MLGKNPLKNAKHEKFAILVAGGIHPSEAYKGLYSATKQISITTAACRLIKSDPVSARIRYIEMQAADAAVIDLARVLKEHTRIAFFDPLLMVDAKGELLPIHKMPEVARRVIGGFDVEIKKSKRGITYTTRKVKLINKEASLDALMKHLGGYEQDHDQKNKGWKEYLEWLNSD